MDEKSIDIIIAVFGCSEEDAEKFLTNESGCYTEIGNRSVFMSGALIHRILKAAEQF